MYKILLLIRDSATQPMWTPYKTKNELNDEEMIEFSTNDLDILEQTIKELILIRPQKTIKAIQDMDYVIDIVVNGTV